MDNATTSNAASQFPLSLYEYAEKHAPEWETVCRGDVLDLAEANGHWINRYADDEQGEAVGLSVSEALNVCRKNEALIWIQESV